MARKRSFRSMTPDQKADHCRKLVGKAVALDSRWCSRDDTTYGRLIAVPLEVGRNTGSYVVVVRIAGDLYRAFHLSILRDVREAGIHETHDQALDDSSRYSSGTTCRRCGRYLTWNNEPDIPTDVALEPCRGGRLDLRDAG